MQKGKKEGEIFLDKVRENRTAIPVKTNVLMQARERLRQACDLTLSKHRRAHTKTPWLSDALYKNLQVFSLSSYHIA